MNTYTITDIKDFNPVHIFQCGQCFRFQQDNDNHNSFTGIAYGKPLRVTLTEEEGRSSLLLHNVTEEEYRNLWHDYFDMGRDYTEIKTELREKDPILDKAISFGEGIRILKQDKWESILSFIISQNNNIPRIKGCIEKLCREFGHYAGSFEGRDYYDIPKAETLAKLSVEDLAECKLGYRAKYIVDMSQQIIELCNKTGASPEGLEFFDEMDNEKAYKTLIGLQGVGPKVANCIMLFGLGRYDSFPIDVWVKKVMAALYGFSEKDVKGMATFAKAQFGTYGGFAQQYLFYYMREKEGNL